MFLEFYCCVIIIIRIKPIRYSVKGSWVKVAMNCMAGLFWTANLNSVSCATSKQPLLTLALKVFNTSLTLISICILMIKIYVLIMVQVPRPIVLLMQYFLSKNSHRNAYQNITWLKYDPLENETREYGPFFNILSCFFAKRQREFVIWPFFNTCANNWNILYS